MTRPQRTVVVISGMHRSGTSLLAQALGALGVNLGEDLDRTPLPSNEDGHWEHAEILRIQHALLDRLGRGFFSARSTLPLPPDWWRDEWLEPVKRELAGVVREELQRSGGPWGFKDPRTLLLQPMWREILDGLDADARYVISVRHPTEVARSLARRDGTSIAHGELMWLAYNLGIARHLEGERLTIVPHRCWFEAPEETAHGIRARLGLEARAGDDLARRLAEVVKPGLWHQVRREERAESPLVEDVFRCLVERAPDPPDFAALGPMLRRFEETQRLLRPWGDELAKTSALAEQVPERDRQIAERDDAIAAREKTIAAREETIAAMQAAVRQRELRIEALEAEGNTFGAQVGRWLMRQRRAWAPAGSPRDRMVKLAVRALRAAHREGARGVLRRIRKRAPRVSRPAPPAAGEARTIFHEGFYLAQCGVAPGTLRDPLHHYSTEGWRQGLNPHPLFDTRWYLEANPSVARAGVNPLEHYVANGWREGRHPSPDFTHYLWLNPDARNWGGSPLAHYVLHGAAEGRPYKLPSAVDPDVANAELRLPTACGAGGGPAEGGAPAPSLLVHVHAFYVEQWDLVAERLAAIPVPFRLAVTSDTREKLDILAASPGLKKLDCAVEWHVTPNRGRDLAPLFVVLGRTALEHDLVLHVHVKRSVERNDPTFGLRWMRHNLDCLLYDRDYVASILRLFRNEPRCGIVQPSPFGPIRPYLDWGGDLDAARGLMRRLGLPDDLPEETPLSFPAGCMFWFRPAALAPVLDGALSLEDFPEEPIPDDGTIAHALERCFVPVAAAGGYHERSVAPLPPEEVPRGDRRPAVSVVIPVRNGAEYLHAAVQSALRQRHGTVPLEILIVDNGSTDGSAEIAAFYAGTFPNVRLLHQPDGGAGAARNLGLEHAAGKHVFFLDADDLLAADAIEKLHRAALRTGAQVVASQLRMYDERESRAPAPAGYGAWGGRHDLPDLCGRPDLSGLPAAAVTELGFLFQDFGPCAKLYEREFLRRHDIRFPESGNYEDNVFVYDAYLNARCLVQLREVTYLYRKLEARRGESRSTGMGLRDVQDQIARLDELAARTDRIANVELGRLIRNCLLMKLQWLVEGDSTAAEHLRTLRADTEALLRRLDAAPNGFLPRRNAKAVA